MENNTGGQPFLTPSVPKQQSHRSLSLSVIILASVIVLLLIAGSGLIYYSAVVQPALFHAQATATALARYQQTTRANATSTAQAFATSQAEANATATVQALATAQAAATATARQAIYTQATHGTPAFNDALAGPNVNNWNVGTNRSGGSCAFTAGALHVSEVQQNYEDVCPAQGTSFGNFAYQVHMTILKGDGSGMIFRATTSGLGYDFLLQQDGTYEFDVWLSGPHLRTLTSGFSPIIRTGLNQPNELTVVARGHSFYLYVNGQYLTHASDGTYAAGGAIGLEASEVTKATQVAFQNAQVWTLA